ETSVVHVGEGIVDPPSTVVRVEVGESPGGVRASRISSPTDRSRAAATTRAAAAASCTATPTDL
ncbi:hypothetical protein ACWC9R_05255, partial [Streptomyces sp. NPDC001219]